MTDKTIDRRLAAVLAKVRKAQHALGSALLERDELIREVVARDGHGTGARLARLSGLTRVRIHQIAKCSPDQVALDDRREFESKLP